MTSWEMRAALAAALTLDDLPTVQLFPSPDATASGPEQATTSPSARHPNAETLSPTPVLGCVTSKRAVGYDAVCLPLTTEAWRTRWRRMCVLPATSAAGSPLARSNEGKDGDGEAAGEASDLDADANEIMELEVDPETRAEAWRAHPAFVPGEVTMTRLDEAQDVTILVSDWLELDATDDWVRHDSEIALLQELSYASYLDVHVAILPPPRNRAHVTSYARAINAALARVPYLRLSVRLPIYDPAIFRARETSASVGPSSSPRAAEQGRAPASAQQSGHRPPMRASEAELNAMWEMWDTLRALCAYNPRLTLTLDLTPPLPGVPGVLARWAAEPIQHVFLPASTFIANAKGYPVLPKGAQSFIRDIMKHRPTVILSGADKGLHMRGGEAAYLQYIRHLEKTSPSVIQATTHGTVENFARGYQDYLQAPLQPLMDNLQSTTYNTFEQDPVKYHKYEEAIHLALSEWPPCDRMVLIVAGAGRGPLVARSLRAIERANRKVAVYAIEKNPNAFMTLQDRKRDEWRGDVTLLFGDMRTLQVPERADIVVSELLGSFGDNELSPECLDGAMRFLKPDGISIPASYTSYLAPLSSSKLYNEVHAGRDDKAAETPYVVMFQAVNILSGPGGDERGRCGSAIQECWDFEHPRRGAVLNELGLPPTNSHNTRSAQLTFHIPHAGVLHGFAGYFEAVLYGDVGLSIHPDRKDFVSKDMLSWFPLFFPLKDPLYLPSNSELHVSLWRLTNTRQIWYEWCAEAFLPVLQPSRARSMHVGTPPASTPVAVDGHGSVLAPASVPYAAPSPLVDAIDNPIASEPVLISPRGLAGTVGEAGVIKIGQTALHNPGGRSSWIGL